MLSKNQIKHIRQLRTSKYRKIAGEFVAEGPKVVGELLLSSYKIKTIYALPSWIELNHKIINSSIPISNKGAEPNQWT